MHNKYRCTCCDKIKTTKTQVMKNYYGRGPKVAICRACNNLMTKLNLKTVKKLIGVYKAKNT